MKAGALVWALLIVVIVLVLVLLRDRLGRPRAASFLVVLGLFALAGEETLLTGFWAAAPSTMDRDGLADLVTAPARAHILDSAVLGTALFVLLGWIALTAFRRGERWAARVLAAGWFVVAAAVAVTMVTVYSRGLPLPTPGGRAEGAGYGWEQLAAGLLAWATGLWVGRR
ncbi:hypothetical protein ACIBG8_35235 [Nonomuraea sp. NPDC050556]|uniref:hypothetical protein n=1 Tax=Nonomuraea sp. NPDC050556 TaxID=3364369 RepID=UPI00378C879C